MTLNGDFKEQKGQFSGACLNLVFDMMKLASFIDCMLLQKVEFRLSHKKRLVHVWVTIMFFLILSDIVLTLTSVFQNFHKILHETLPACHSTDQYLVR